MENIVLVRCDISRFGNSPCFSTYYNEILGHESTIDYFLTSNRDTICHYDVLDPHINLSDHRPIFVECHCQPALYDVSSTINQECSGGERHNANLKRLRWDHCNIDLYRELTGLYLRPVMDELIDLEKNANSVVVREDIDRFYNHIVDALNYTVQMLLFLLVQRISLNTGGTMK